MPKTHEILNAKRKGHPNFPCPGPKIVQWVKKLLRIIWGNMVFKLTGEKQSQTKAKITVETEALFTFVAMCLFSFSVEDLEMNDGSAEKPYYMSDSLKKILHLQNREQPDGTEAGGEK